MNDPDNRPIALQKLTAMEEHLRLIALAVDKLMSGAWQKAFEEGKRAANAERAAPPPQRRCTACGDLFQPTQIWMRTCRPCWEAVRDAKRDGARPVPTPPAQDASEHGPDSPF